MRSLCAPRKSISAPRACVGRLERGQWANGSSSLLSCIGTLSVCGWGVPSARWVGEGAHCKGCPGTEPGQLLQSIRPGPHGHSALLVEFAATEEGHGGELRKARLEAQLPLLEKQRCRGAQRTKGSGSCTLQGSRESPVHSGSALGVEPSGGVVRGSPWGMSREARLGCLRSKRERTTTCWDRKNKRRARILPVRGAQEAPKKGLERAISLERGAKESQEERAA